MHRAASQSNSSPYPLLLEREGGRKCRFAFPLSSQERGPGGEFPSTAAPDRPSIPSWNRSFVEVIAMQRLDGSSHREP